MTIGDFSRATRLTAKTLRFYHQVGLLEPAEVDPTNGYRLYTPDQIADAQVIRQFRALEMPVDLIRHTLAAPDAATRNDLIAGHLARMEAQLEQTRSAIASLRGLLEQPSAPFAPRHLRVAATPALLIGETIDLADLSRWYTDALSELARAVETSAVRPAGPRGGIWDTALFLDERGSAVVFVPLRSPPDGNVLGGLGFGGLGFGGLGFGGRARVETLPPVDLIVATHEGTDATIGQVYGALGDHVARHETSADGPIRESYVREATQDGGPAITEIGWPVLR